MPIPKGRLVCRFARPGLATLVPLHRHGTLPMLGSGRSETIDGRMLRGRRHDGPDSPAKDPCISVPEERVVKPAPDDALGPSAASSPTGGARRAPAMSEAPGGRQPQASLVPAGRPRAFVLRVLRESVVK